MLRPVAFACRITAIISGDSHGMTTFEYDRFGRRIQISGPLNTTNYLYDGDDMLEEIDNSSSVLARYGQGVGIDEPISVLRSSATNYYEADEALGSITSLSNGAGALASTYTYDSFGNLTTSTGTLTNPFRYTGRDLDSESGLYFYRARYFDPAAGRFISEDPSRFAGGIDFYEYVDNSPLNEFDPLGLAGGPKMPRGARRCTYGDSCKLLRWKMVSFEDAIYSHLGWDWYMPWPRGTGRHSQEISDLYNGLARCIQIYEKRCKDDKHCSKSEGFPDPVPQPDFQPNTPTTLMPVPIDPVVPPMPMPEPTPIEIPFEPIFAPI
ncbi:MAG TPA: RHS repeat-associated core domain-containing protein [Candidatus Eisenbacteria bacterium]|nr:RHS repeat-associated core domain-containing protein [Candidatus Eisenbacteria bacterium]